MNNTESVDKISEDLINQVRALKALVTVHGLLANGLYQHKHSEAVAQSLQFVENLHKNALEQALAHPEAYLIEELKQYQSEKETDEEQETKDGETN